MNRDVLVPWLLAGLVLATGPARAAGVADDARATLREHLKNPAFSLDRKPEYVITDPAFIEPVLDQALRYIDLSPPLSPATLAKAKRNAETYYRLHQQKPDGLKALEAVIARRFAQPVVTRRAGIGDTAGEIVELDFGWMIGPLTHSTRSGIVHEHDAVSVRAREGQRMYFEPRGPATRQLARLLADATRAYPRAERVRLVITFPYPRLGRDLRATYIRSGASPSLHGWVQLQSTPPSARPLYQVWVPDEDFSPYIEGRYSFYVDCTPVAGVGRVPRPGALSEDQRQRCLTKP